MLLKLTLVNCIIELDGVIKISGVSLKTNFSLKCSYSIGTSILAGYKGYKHFYSKILFNAISILVVSLFFKNNPYAISLITSVFIIPILTSFSYII